MAIGVGLVVVRAGLEVAGGSGMAGLWVFLGRTFAGDRAFFILSLMAVA